jgi:hypothetical protein
MRFGRAPRIAASCNYVALPHEVTFRNFERTFLQMRHLCIKPSKMPDNYCISPIIISIHLAYPVVVNLVDNIFNNAVSRG